MKKLLLFVSAAMIMMLGSAFMIQSIINWKIDAEKAMIKFTMQAHGHELIGNFKGAKGEVKFDEKNLANASITCSVDVSTINTGIEARDKHLQAKGFFNAALNPVIKFSSSKIEKVPEGYRATGTLLMKETSKEVSIPFVFANNPEAGVFKGSFIVKRSDYNIGKPDGDMSDEITINLEVPVKKAE